MSGSDPNIKKPIIHENNGSMKLMTPNESRLRGFTYSSPIYTDISVNIDIEENGNIIALPEKIIKDILFGKIPIMVKSKYCILDDYKNNYLEMNECKYDHGGYFIINGKEKVFLSQEKKITNILYINQSEDLLRVFADTGLPLLLVILPYAPTFFELLESIFLGAYSSHWLKILLQMD